MSKVVKDIRDQLAEGETEETLDQIGMGPTDFPNEWVIVREELAKEEAERAGVQAPVQTQEEEEEEEEEYIPSEEEEEDSDSDEDLYQEEDEEGQEEEDDYALVIRHQAAETIETFKTQIINIAYGLLQNAPVHVREELVLLLSNSITNHKVQQFDCHGVICCIVLESVCPGVTVVNISQTTFQGRVPQTVGAQPNGIYYVLLHGHAIAVIKRDDCVYAYDSNGVNLPSNIMQQLRGLFGNTLVVYGSFNPHITEEDNVLSRNIFIGVSGRCACWALFCCMLLRRCSTRAHVDSLNTFFGSLTGARARVMSTYIICFFMRTLWMAKNVNEPRYTPMEQQFRLQDVDNTAFPFFRSIRGVVLETVRRYNMERDRVFQTRSAGGTGRQTGITREKLLDMIRQRNGKSLVLTRCQNRRNDNAQVIPPRAHVHIDFEFWWCGDVGYDYDTVMQIDVPYQVLQEQMDEPLTWGYIMDWIKRKAMRKYGHIKRTSGDSVLDFDLDIITVSGVGGSVPSTPPYAHSRENDEACFCYVPSDGGRYEIGNTDRILQVGKCGNYYPVVSLDRFDPAVDHQVFIANVHDDGITEPIPYDPQRRPFRYHLVFQLMNEPHVVRARQFNHLHELKYGPNYTAPLQFNARFNTFPRFLRESSEGGIDHQACKTWFVESQRPSSIAVCVRELAGMYICEDTYRRLPLLYKILVERQGIPVYRRHEIMFLEYQQQHQQQQQEHGGPQKKQRV